MYTHHSAAQSSFIQTARHIQLSVFGISAEQDTNGS